MIEFSERGNEVIFGNAVEKNMVGAEVHIPSRVWLLRTSLGDKYGCKPA